MRIVVVGASGNVGSAVLGRLAREKQVDRVAGVVRRPPAPTSGQPYAGVAWHRVDIGDRRARDDLVRIFAGADAVIHLAWQIQPSHDRARLRRTNVEGSANVTAAAIRAGVPALIAASSMAAYAPGPKSRTVDEGWPVTGVPGSSYSRDKAELEAMLEQVQRDYPQLRVVRLRSAPVFQGAAASEIARFFIGPLVPLGLLRFGRLPMLPRHHDLRIQAVHANDVADAYVRAALATNVRGVFNVAAEPVLDVHSVGTRFDGIGVPVPLALLRWGAALTWHARLQPTEPGWVRLAAQCPLMSTRRIRDQLGWRPTITALDALAELLAAMSRRTGAHTAPLRPRPAAPARLGALLAGRLPGHGDPY